MKTEQQIIEEIEEAHAELEEANECGTLEERMSAFFKWSDAEIELDERRKGDRRRPAK